MQFHTLWRWWGTWGVKSPQIVVYSEGRKRRFHKDGDDLREVKLTSDWEQNKCRGIFKLRAEVTEEQRG